MPSCDSFGNVDGDGECRIGFLLTPTFSILPFISAVEPLRVANRFSGRAVYSWHVFSSDGEPVLAANGMAMAVDVSIQEVASFPTVIVFRRYLASTPARYYMELRLQHGRQLLEQTAMPVTEVALACGFASPGHFSYRYRALFGLSPQRARRSV